MTRETTGDESGSSACLIINRAVEEHTREHTTFDLKENGECSKGVKKPSSLSAVFFGEGKIF